MLRPFFSFYGSKWRLAPKYPKPAYDHVIEPFAGSAGYSLRYPHLAVSLYDADPKICGVWDYIIHAPATEIRSLPLLSPGGSILDYDIPEEAKHLIGFWLTLASGSGASTMPGTKWALRTPDQMWGAARRERIASQSEYVRHWTIATQSYNTIDQCEATWFVDPPYTNMGHAYRYSDIDYTDLARWCNNLKGQVMVCENEGADWLPFEPFNTPKDSMSKRNTPEVMWVNEKLA